MEVWGITSKAERPYDFIQAVKDHQLHQKGVNVIKFNFGRSNK
ncbi:hypothetical protein PEDI_50700 [Persicobacter diffluens]|uniref:Uncharacterized protein n=1 Tax=Persicobacter diffluens TaxID=981 RepID=A0AAN4W4J4_9BACT|nr:hypothetical protein PEDI_50700 [Persicobacter diffluens]